MIAIDGSLGEGGGQILRSALALSILTRQAVEIDNIRANRSKPGLRAQHLKAVDTAAAISRARVEGAVLNSTRLIFVPGDIRTGRYKVDIGTAGSTSLVLQTVFLPLSLADSASTLIITGGTHVQWAPCYHYLEFQWLPYMKRLGFDAQIHLDKAGFYPQGGGRITATIRPARSILPIMLVNRGPLNNIEGLSAVANLDLSIADRQKWQALRHLQGSYPATRIKSTQLPSPNKGTMLLLTARFQPLEDSPPAQACYFSLGELGKPAERVADEAVESLHRFLESDGAIDQYLADQMLLPLSFAGGQSQIHTAKITQHLLTNAHIIRAFTSTAIDIQGELGEPGVVKIDPANFPYGR